MMVMNNPVNQPWKFYGRTEDLVGLINEITFSAPVAIAITGRRQVGKTELLSQVIDRIHNMDQKKSKPILYMEIPGESDDIGRELQQAIEKNGLNHLMEDLVKHDEPYLPTFSFRDQLEHLVKKNVVVCLDEFHNCENYNGLVSYIKIIIDSNRNLSKTPSVGGIVATGSHQQHMLRMIGDPEAPLYKRFDKVFPLKQLEPRHLLQMACDHGWLSEPRQFLTMYSAFGGMPGLWRNYYLEESRSKWGTAEWDTAVWAGPSASENYKAWQMDFWRSESLRPLQNVREGYDYKGFVELNPVAELILTEISKKPNGTRRATIYNMEEIPELAGRYGWKETIRRNLVVLEKHLQIIKETRPYLNREESAAKYRMVDNDTRHQLLVKSLNLDEEDIRTASVESYHQLIRNTEEREGPDLERFTADFFRDLHLHEFDSEACESRYGVQLVKDGPEIDVLARIDNRKSGQKVTLKLASCKRNPKAHLRDSTSPEKLFGEFLEQLFDNREQKRPEDIQCILVSPKFTYSQVRELEKRNFITLDLPTMARKFGFEPEPDQKHHS